MRPRLLHITTVPSTLWAFFRGLCGYLGSSGYEVHAASSPGPLLDRFRADTGIATHGITMDRSIRPVHDGTALVRLTALIRRLGPTIVHAHTPKAGLLGMLAATMAGSPIRIYHAHGLRYVTSRGARRALLHGAERLSCSLADRVLAVAPSLRDQMIGDGLCPARSIRVPGNGSFCGVDAIGRFDPARFDRRRLREELSIPSDAPVVGFVGRIVRDKGIDELLAAWRRLRRDHPAAHLLLVGAMEPEDPIAPGLRRELEQDRRIRRLGEVLDVAPYYRVMDLLVLPSRREGFGIVALEGAAMELPVVASRIVGLVDAVVDGVTGSLCDPASPELLRAAIERYLADPALRAKHGAAGRRRAREQFREEQAWAGLAAEYSDLLRLRGFAIPDRA